MSFVFTKNSVKSLDNKQQQYTVTVIPAPSIRSLFGVGKAHTLVLKGEDGVVGPEEDVSQDPQRPGGGRQVDSHEPADALGLPGAADLEDVLVTGQGEVPLQDRFGPAGRARLGRLFRRIIQHRLVKLGLGRAMTVDSPCRFDPEPPLAPRELTKRGGDPHRDRGGSARGAPRSSRRARGRPAEGP